MILSSLDHHRPPADRNRLYAAAALVAALTLCLFLPALQNDFVNWDDDEYVYDNPMIRALNPTFLRWAFTGFAASNWHPLAWVSHAADYALWGLNPAGHHLTSLLLHAFNTFFVVVLCARLLEDARSGRVPADARDRPSSILAAAVAGLLFGIHPIHVESVAWVSERKDVLCAFFVLASLLAYRGHALAPAAGAGGRAARFYPLNRHYAASLALFVLAAMSKPMAVTLPVTLLILDWFPFQRIRGSRSFWGTLLEKAPFLAIALATASLTILAQSREAIVPLRALSLSTRTLVAFRGVFSYLKHMLLPVGLTPLYPYPANVTISSAAYLVPVAFVLAATVGAVVLFKRRKAFLALWGVYLVTLLPVIGIVQVAGQSLADRYAYLPSIPPFLAFGAAASLLYARTRNKALLFVPALLAAGALIFALQAQIRVWKNGETLWSREIRREPRYSPGYSFRAEYYGQQGRFEEGLRDVEVAVRLAPGSPVPFYARGRLLSAAHLHREAVADFTRAIDRSDHPEFRFYKERARSYAALGMPGEALRDYTEVLRLSPGQPQIHASRGAVLLRLGEYDKAVEDYTLAIRLSPAFDAEQFRGRGNAYAKLGLLEKAESDLRRAAR